VDGLKWLLGTYTARYNRRHKLFGRLFSGRYKELERGWCLGGEAFRKELLAQMSERGAAERYGEEIRESAQAQAERLIGRELEQLGWQAGDLARLRKGDPGKVRMAVRLRKETTMSLSWIAQRLEMGTKSHLAHLLYWQGKRKA
jgi:hypothetical protein